MWAPGARYHAISRRGPAFCGLYPAAHGVKPRYGFTRTCPLATRALKTALEAAGYPALMDRQPPLPRRGGTGRAAAIGDRLARRRRSGWHTAVLADDRDARSAPWCRWSSSERAGRGSAAPFLLMWTCFFTANAIRSRRTHSVISAPCLSAGRRSFSPVRASGLIEVQIWMVWVLGAGIIAANLSERFIGKYL